MLVTSLHAKDTVNEIESVLAFIGMFSPEIRQQNINSEKISQKTNKKVIGCGKCYTRNIYPVMARNWGCFQLGKSEGSQRWCRICHSHSKSCRFLT